MGLGFHEEPNVTSSGSARRARRNAALPDSPSDAARPAPSLSSTVVTRAATATKASKTAVAVKTPKSAAKPAAAKPAPANKPNGADAATPESSKRAPTRAREDKDRPLFEDIRFLGRLLGEVLREQEGDAVFDVVEAIRQTAVKFHREDDGEASQTLEKRLRQLTPEQTVSVVRAFSYFSHLANIAEDRHHNRRRRIHALAGSAPQAGTMAYAIEQMQAKSKGEEAKALLQKFFDDALIVPVLTAHPTEVQRKSILDAQHDIARLLAERDQEFARPASARTTNRCCAHASRRSGRRACCATRS